MRFAIIVSTLDPAGMNIRDKLINEQHFKDAGEKFEGEPIYTNGETLLYTVTKRTIDCEHIDKDIKADIICFATKHQSEKGVPSLSVHAPGNWGKAEMGGSDRELSIAAASCIKEGLNILEKKDHADHDVTVEATHHGPLLDTPCFFIEIGSDEDAWKDPKAGSVIAETIIEIIKKQPEYPAAILLGGGHYNHEANKIILRSDIAIGHICPKYALDNLDEEIFNKAIERNKEKIDLVILDWKGLGPNKERIKKIIEKKGIKVVRSKDVR